MKKGGIAISIFPAVIMFIVLEVCFSNMSNFNGLDFKGIFILSLILGFPILFFIQGVLTATSNISIFLTLGVSTIAFFILMFMYLNSSASLYIILYLLCGFIGYGINKFRIKKKI